MFCALSTMYLRERLVETESAGINRRSLKTFGVRDLALGGACPVTAASPSA